MSVKKIIFSTELQEFRPIIWYGEPVFIRYSQLKAILTEKFGEQYAAIISEPVANREVIEGKGKAHWMSDYVTNGVQFSKLPQQQQEQARQQLTQTISQIKNFANELKISEDANQKQLGELLLLAVEVPALDYVFVEGNKICLVLWGFTSEEAKKTNFQISKVLEAPIVPKVPETKIVQEVQKNEPLPIEKQIQDNQKVTTQQAVVPPVVATPPPIPPQKEKKGMPAWLWFIIGALLMLLILFLFWWFYLRHHSALPDNANVLPPIDTTKVGHDPNDTTKRKILIDRVNVALKKNADMEAFAKTIKEKFGNNLEIVYFDTTIKLLQLKTPENEWKKWADTLKNVADVRLTFSEALFARNETFNDAAFTDAKKAWYFKEIGVFDAWKTTKGSDKIVVAIIDNGFDITHPEFKDKVVNSWNVFLHSSNVHPVGMQGSEHGTHVAASAIGLLNNSLGLSGIAPNCKFMPIQVADENGNMSTLAVVAGLLYAIHHNADVVNMSLGMMFPPEVAQLSLEKQKELVQSLYPEEAKFWDELYSFGLENKMIIVQAAGNCNILAGIDPACRSLNTIIVSAVSPNIQRAEFSNWGELTVLSAPGVEIYSAVPNNKYEFLQGTSMASPIVAGCVALMKSIHPNFRPRQIIDILVKTAKAMNSDKYIAPMIQIDKAILADSSGNVMIIPKDAKDLTFAEGTWKSTTDLHSTDKKKVELYFDIKKDGNGKLKLVEENGNQCFADLKITFKDGKLLLDQLDNAKCQNAKFYRKYEFQCVQGSDNQADCTAKEKGSTSDVIKFNLVKQ